MMTAISIKLPAELEARLTRLSRERNVTPSVVVREALQAYLPPVNCDKRSCFDLAGDVPGSLEGPADLASNPQHLKGYGL